MKPKSIPLLQALAIELHCESSSYKTNGPMPVRINRITNKTQRSIHQPEFKIHSSTYLGMFVLNFILEQEVNGHFVKVFRTSVRTHLDFPAVEKEILSPAERWEVLVDLKREWTRRDSYSPRDTTD